MSLEKANKLYLSFPSVMTARGLNMKKGLYLKIPYQFTDGKFMWYPYIRFTKKGYVLYRVNGYPQPFYAKAGEKVRRYRHWWNVCYTDKVVAFVEELLGGRAVLATADKGDFIKCTDHGIMALVPYGENCPLCSKEGHSSWAMDGVDETDTRSLENMGLKVYRAD